MILTTLDNKMSLLVGSDYLTKLTSGDTVFHFIKNCVKKVQCCLACLERMPKSTSGILDSCLECSKNILDVIWTPGEQWSKEGQLSAFPSLKVCDHCRENRLQGVKLVVLVWASDSEANNHKAMKTIKEAKE